MAEWKEFTCSDSQIAEINSCKKFKLLRNDGVESFVSEPPFIPSDMIDDLRGTEIEETTHYIILE